MRQDLDVIVTGFDVEQRQAETAMVRLFGLEPMRAKRFVEQLPVVAKRCSDRALADRYAEALRAIGARVEVRSHGAAFRDSLPPVATTSLPAPPPELAARLRESVRVSRAADSAIARFREAEGLEPLSSELGFDPYNPAIPKAPALPRDLARMPNAKLERPSDRPEWMVSDPLSLTPDAASGTPPALQRHDAQPPPRGRPSRDSGMRPRRSTPDGKVAVGVAHEARASVRPGMSGHAPARTATFVPWRRRVLRAWPALIGALMLAGVGAWQAGWTKTDADRRREVWQHEGTRAAEHEDIRTFLARPSNLVQGIDETSLRDLVDKLERAGATKVYAIEIERTGETRRAGALLVELPRDPAARRTLRFHAAEAQGGSDAPAVDNGERHMVIAFD
jgi:hypothetical protein